MYDAIVVGARCAGSPTAMLLARKGYRVLLLDRDTFPSDIMSSHYIWQPGVASLKGWGLLDKVVASNCPPIGAFAFDVGPFALKGTPPPADGVAEAFAPRRTVLDKILLDAAVEAGAEVRQGFSVQEVVVDGERVIGVRGRTQGGSTVTEEARLVIGADGSRSVLARTVQATEYDAQPALSCAYYSYWSGVPMAGLEYYAGPARMMAAFPTNDGLTCIIIFWPSREFREYRSDIEGNFLKTVDLAPGLAQRVRDGRREERFVGTVKVENFLRKPYGPGWALVGDAGYHKDPITAQGITDAFRDAGLLAEAIDTGLSQGSRLEEALASYEQQRNEAVMPMYQFTCQLATLDEPLPAEMQQLFGALRGNQAETDRLWGAFAGTVPIPEFFSPDNMQRIIDVAQEA